MHHDDFETELLTEFQRSINTRAHNISLQIADLYIAMYNLCKLPVATEENKKAADEMLTAYRNIRRCISVNPRTGRRYGAVEAGRAMCGVFD